MFDIRKFFYAVFFIAFSTTIYSANTTEYQLPNGLKLVVREDHRAPVVFSSVWYKVGGSYENDGSTGLSHMLEHMMFTGTQKFAPGRIDKIISENGGMQNATTDLDYTVFFQELKADKLPISFALESDRMHNLKLLPALFEREKKVVLEERRQRVDDNPQTVAWERFSAAAHVNNPYHHMTIGWMNDIQHFTLQDVKNWYHEWYKPNNAIVIVVGDVQPANVYQLALKYFGAIPASETPAVKPRQELEAMGVKTVKIIIPAKLPWLVMGYNVPEINSTAETWKVYALYVASIVLSGGDSSWLTKDLVRGKEIAVDAEASYQPYRKYTDLFVLSGVPAPGHSLGDLKNNFQNEVLKMQTTLISEDELTRVKAQIIAANMYEQDSLMNQVLDLGAVEALGLSWKVSDDFVKNIQAVTASQIQTVAKEYFKSERLTVGYLQPKTS